MKITTDIGDIETEASAPKAMSGAQTLQRGLDVLARVAVGDSTLSQMAKALDLNKSTVHRLATTLVEANFLSQSSRDGYSLGTKLLELGFAASQQISLTRIARPHLLQLSADTGDTVNLGVMDRNQVYFIDKIPGNRRIEVRCVIGERQMFRPTGLGKAMLLDEDEAGLCEVFTREAKDHPHYKYDMKAWLEVMAFYRTQGYALDLDENEDRIRCVAAPVRDGTKKIIAAISVSSAAQYMSDDRIETLKDYVKGTALAISRDFGFNT